jgi:hypothetical protein
MNYALQEIVVYKGTYKDPARGNYFWAQGRLFYEEDPYDNPSQLPVYTILQEAVVSMLRKVAKPDPADATRFIVDETALQKAIDDKKFADETPCKYDLLHVKNVFPHTIKLTGNWVRIATRPITITLLNGTTRTINKGEVIVGANGAATPVTEIRVYIKHNADGNPVEEPSAVVNRILERRYKPLEAISSTPINQPSTQAPTETQTPEAEKEAEKARLQAELAALGV